MDARDGQELTFSKYAFLKELGLEEENLGCYSDGKWLSSGGEQQVSVNPHDNKAIANTKMASLDDYEATIKGM